MKKRTLLSLLSLAFLFILVLSFKNSSASITPEYTDTFTATTTNADCSEYYHLNNIGIDIKPRMVHSVSGSDMPFSGFILNNNPYPIVNGKLYAKVLRERNVNDGNGPDVLDEFVIKDNIVLNAGQKMPISFNWPIPAYAISGNYRLATYFISNNEFNLAGLSFSDSFAGAIFNFSIKGQQDMGVFFKKDGIKIDNIAYHSESATPAVSATSTVMISMPVLNTTKERQVVKMDFTVYKWDAQSVKNKIDSFSKNTIIESGKTINIPIEIKDNTSSVYYVEGVLKYRDVKSIVNIRFVRDGVNMPKIDFPSIVSYPLISGQKNKIFACFHNASNTGLPVDTKLKIEILTDDNINPILSYEYNGKVSGELSAVAQDFTPSRSYGNFKLHASLFSGSKLIDDIYIPYNCSQIDPNQCSLFDKNNLKSNKWLTAILNILGILISLFVIIFVMLRYNKIRIFLHNFMINHTKSLILLAMLLSALSIHSTALAVTCNRPTITKISSPTPPEGVTTGGTSVQITGTNFNNVSSVFIGNAKVSSFTVSSVNTKITFTTPASTPGWKDIAIKSSCDWHEMIPVANAFFYYKTSTNIFPPIPSDTFWNWSPRTYNYSSVPVTNSALYYTSDLTNGTLSNSGISSSTAVIYYSPYVSDSDGLVLGNGSTVSVGKSLNFNFNSASSTISWTRYGYIGSTYSGSWLSDATYPAQVCVASNFVGTADVFGLYAPLSVNTPGNVLAFNADLTTSVNSLSSLTFPSWGAPAVPNDSSPSSWSCNADNTICQPNGNGYKSLYMYNSPTFGNYYYGLTQNGVCITNGVPLNKKMQVTVNIPPPLPIESVNSRYHSWLSLASSADGSKLVGITNSTPSQVYTSKDYGKTWATSTMAGSLNALIAVTSSSDGAKLAVADFGGYLYTSTNSGLTWTKRMPDSTRGWGSIASSADGTKLVAGVIFGYIYTSTDGGSTWATSTKAGYDRWSNIISSADGTKFVASTQTGYLHVSTDSGLNWATSTMVGGAIAGPRSWWRMASSADGSKVFAADEAGNLYKSLDYGLNWATSTLNTNSYTVSGIALSSDATKVAVSTSYIGGYIYYSTSSGATWKNLGNYTNDFSPMVSSSDGTKFAMIDWQGSYSTVWTLAISTTTQPVGTSTCTAGTSSCSGLFLKDLQGNVAGCPTSYPYYNFDNTTCYQSFSDYTNSPHTDANVASSSVLMSYYYPQLLKFRESVYNLNLNIVTPTNRPSTPVISGPTNVIVDQSNNYSAVSSLSVSKNKTNFFLATFLSGTKEALATAPTNKVRYKFDWDNNGVVDYTSADVAYNTPVTASKTWISAGSTQFKVMAEDVDTNATSSWATYSVTVSASPNYVYNAPTGVAGTSCGGSLKMTWPAVSVYSVYGSSPAPSQYWVYESTNPSIPIGYITATNNPSFIIDLVNNPIAKSYYVYSVGPKSASDSNPTTSAPSATISPTYSSGAWCNSATSTPFIKSGVKFYTNPSWAGTNSKCTFYGSYTSPIIDKNDVQYNDVSVTSCHIDNDGPGTADFSGNLAGGILKSVGKHTLYCSMTYSIPGTTTPATGNFYIDAKCSQIPKVIER